MFCPSCGKQIDNNVKFCPFCGASTAAPPPPAPTAQQPFRQPTQAQTVQPAQNGAYSFDAAALNQPEPPAPTYTAPSAPAEIPTAATPAVIAAQSEKNGKGKKPKKEKKPKKQKQPHSTEQAAAVQSAENGRSLPVTVGSAVFTAFLMIELLPYLLSSITMLVTQRVMSPALVILWSLVGYAAAAAVLIGASRLLSGRAQLDRSLLLVGLIAALRTAQSLLLSNVSMTSMRDIAIKYGAAVIVGFVVTLLLITPLGALFSPRNNFKQGGAFGALIMIAFSMLAPTALNALWYFSPLHDEISFMSTFSYKLFAAFIEAGFMALAANRLLKKQTDKLSPEKGKGIVSLIAGGALLAASIAAMFIGTGIYSVTKAAGNDFLYFVMKGKLYMANGDMNSAVESFETANEHCQAWLAAADGDSYSAPENKNDDSVLLYLTFVNGNEDRLQRYLLDSLNSDTANMLAPLMLDRYAKRDTLTDEEAAHRSELVAVCIGNETFTHLYPTSEDLMKKSGELIKMFDSDPTFSRDLMTAKVFADAQKGESSTSSVIETMLSAAEEYPTDISLQYAAAIIGSSNKWDSASHYGRTAEAALRFRKLWKEGSADADDETKLRVDSGIAEVLINVEKYDEAASILEEANAYSPNTKSVKEMLSRCYTELGETKKSSELAKEMFDAYPNDVSAQYSYFLSTLKGKNTSEAIKAASALADEVKKDPTDGDTLLFNCVSYLAQYDGTAGFTDMVYTEDTADEPTRQIAENEFLNDYCEAIYNEKQKRNYEKALEYVDSALKAQDGSARLWYLKGIILFNLEKFEESEKALLKADALDPDDLSILYALANTYDAMEKYEEAYNYCERVIAKYPNGADHSEDVYGAMPHAVSLRNSLASYVSKGGN